MADVDIKIFPLVIGAASVLATVGLFFLRDYLDINRKRKNSAIALSLYASIISRSLSRNILLPLPFGMKEVLDSGGNILYCRASVELMLAIEDAVCVINSSISLGGKILREDRERLINVIFSKSKCHNDEFKLPDLV